MASSYSTAVLYIGLIQVWDFLPTPKPAWYILCDTQALLVMHSLRSTLHSTTKLIWNFKNFLFNRIFCWLIDWPTNRLTDRPTDWLLLNNDYSYTVDFFTNQRCFVPRCAFLPTAAAPVLASWFYQALPLFLIPFSLPHRWWFVVVCFGFGARLE